MGSTFSLPGQATNYIQVNELGLQTCLANQTDNNAINNCISTNIVAPSVNSLQQGVNTWTGNGIPINSACPAGKTTSQKNVAFGGVDKFEMLNMSASQNNITLLAVIIVTLLIVYMKK
jgi:hypothetical protein